MAELVLQTNIAREPEYLYFVKKDIRGCIGIYKAKMKRGGKKK